MNKKHHLYVLYDKATVKPIYIGLSSSIKSRIANHKRDKVFDGVFIIESFDDKKQGLAAERSLIKFFSFFENDKIINAKYVRFHLENTNLHQFQNRLKHIENGRMG